MNPRHAARLETVSVLVPDAAVEAYEAALRSVCQTVAFLQEEPAASGDRWRIEGVRPVAVGQGELVAALALAAAVSGFEAELRREPTPAEGWLARTHAAFPEQRIGRRFAVRGTHLSAASTPGRITLVLDAGLAFGSGEHGSTRGCLRALERVRRERRPLRVLDMGTGSGILAIAAARLLRRKVLATDIEPWSVRVARANAAQNRVGPLVRCRRADGWRDRGVRRGAPYDLVFANILARPLCAMARSLAVSLAPGGDAILSGLLHAQARMVLAAHRRNGLVLRAVAREGGWTTLVVRRPAPATVPRGDGRSGRDLSRGRDARRRTPDRTLGRHRRD